MIKVKDEKYQNETGFEHFKKSKNKKRNGQRIYTCRCLTVHIRSRKKIHNFGSTSAIDRVPHCTVLNPLNLKSDQHLISPFSITCESHIKVMRTKEMITIKTFAFDWWTNSPCQHLMKSIENSLENMHTDVRVYKVNP